MVDRPPTPPPTRDRPYRIATARTDRDRPYRTAIVTDGQVSDYRWTWDRIRQRMLLIAVSDSPVDPGSTRRYVTSQYMTGTGQTIGP